MSLMGITAGERSVQGHPSTTSTNAVKTTISVTGATATKILEIADATKISGRVCREQRNLVDGGNITLHIAVMLVPYMTMLIMQGTVLVTARSEDHFLTLHAAENGAKAPDPRSEVFCLTLFYPSESS